MVSSTARRAISAPTFSDRDNVQTMGDMRRRRALRLSVVLDDPTRKARLAYAIRSARDRRKMTPPQLASLLGVGRGTVNKWESGEQVPNLLMLGPLCDALGVDANLFAVLPPIPDWEGESYLMDDPADRAALAALDAGAQSGSASDDESDDPKQKARARS